MIFLQIMTNNKHSITSEWFKDFALCLMLIHDIIIDWKYYIPSIMTIKWQLSNVTKGLLQKKNQYFCQKKGLLSEPIIDQKWKLSKLSNMNSQ